MRVAYVTRAPFISGAERSLQTLLRWLPGTGVEPLVIGPANAAIIPWCEAHGIPFRACPLAFRDKLRPLRWWQSWRSLWTVLREERIDLVHSNQVWSYPPVGAAGRSLGLPRVCHMRDDVSPEAVRWCCALGVEGIVCVSRHIAGQVAAAWNDRKKRPRIEAILNPVVAPELSAADEEQARLEARRRWGIGADTLVFGFLGQITPVKGLPLLLEALAGLAEEPRWVLLVAGQDPRPGAPHEVACRELVQRRGLTERVRFLGFLEDVSPVYQALDCAVMPSLQEPLGRIALEAAAHARPTIASTAGGLPEIVHHGETGWLVPVGEVEALRETLALFLRRPVPQLGAAARAWIRETCSPERFAGRMAALYRDLLRPAVPTPVVQMA